MKAETKFTKGEWIFNKYTPCDFGVHSLEGRGNDIALVRGSDEEAEANAKLISTAPELLESLELLVNILHFMGKHLTEFGKNEVRKAFEVIQKATE